MPSGSRPRNEAPYERFFRQREIRAAPLIYSYPYPTLTLILGCLYTLPHELEEWRFAEPKMHHVGPDETVFKVSEGDGRDPYP